MWADTPLPPMPSPDAPPLLPSTGLSPLWLDLAAVQAFLICSGRGLARHTGRTFSMVTTGLCCLQIPLGTILGVFTVVALPRPSVQALYATADSRKLQAATTPAE